jgi:hypothetical protein
MLQPRERAALGLNILYQLPLPLLQLEVMSWPRKPKSLNLQNWVFDRTASNIAAWISSVVLPPKAYQPALQLVGIVSSPVSDISWRFNPNWFRKPIYFIKPLSIGRQLHGKQKAVPEYPMQ